MKENPQTLEWKSIKEHGNPPAGIALIVTVFDKIRYKRELVYPVVYRQSFCCGEYGFFEHGLEDGKLLPEYREVLAWVEVPSVYEG